MKLIDDIIYRLERKQDVADELKPVIAYMLKEMRRMETQKDGIINVPMSLEMYKYFFHHVYTPEGAYKAGLIEEVEK